MNADIDTDDEIMTAKDLARSMKVSVRQVQKLFELGLIQTFHRGRERVTLRSMYHSHLQDLIDAEATRLDVEG